MTSNNILQVKQTFGNVPNSELWSVEQLYLHYKNEGRRMSVLTPTGYRQITEVIVLNKEPELVELQYMCGGSKQSLVTDPNQKFFDFNAQELKPASELTSDSAILTYTNTELKCWGFQLQQSLATITKVTALDKQIEQESGVYSIIGNFDKFYINRLLGK